MRRLQFLSIKDAGVVVEIFGRIGREKLKIPIFAEPVFHLRMTLQIVRQTAGYDLTL
jgi:hypothetical protein